MPTDETMQAVLMRLAKGSVKAAWLLQAIITAQEEQGDWVIGSREDWSITTGLTLVQIRDALLTLDRLELITRKQAYVKGRRSRLLHVRLARNADYAVNTFATMAHGRNAYPTNDWVPPA